MSSVPLRAATERLAQGPAAWLRGRLMAGALARQSAQPGVKRCQVPPPSLSGAVLEVPS